MLLHLHGGTKNVSSSPLARARSRRARGGRGRTTRRTTDGMTIIEFERVKKPRHQSRSDQAQAAMIKSRDGRRLVGWIDGQSWMPMPRSGVVVGQALSGAARVRPACSSSIGLHLHAATTTTVHGRSRSHMGASGACIHSRAKRQPARAAASTTLLASAETQRRSAGRTTAGTGSTYYRSRCVRAGRRGPERRDA
jgi:hypothetical protein